VRGLWEDFLAVPVAVLSVQYAGVPGLWDVLWGGLLEMRKEE
jgi:hypothetical protein